LSADGPIVSITLAIVLNGITDFLQGFSPRVASSCQNISLYRVKLFRQIR
jgi:hypothetical protein